MENLGKEIRSSLATRDYRSSGFLFAQRAKMQKRLRQLIHFHLASEKTKL